MRKNLLFASAVFASVSTNLFAAKDCGVAVVNTEQARIRDMPSAQSKVIKTMPKSSEICVYDIQNNYALINNKSSQWVNIDLLNFMGETRLVKN